MVTRIAGEVSESSTVTSVTVVGSETEMASVMRTGTLDASLWLSNRHVFRLLASRSANLRAEGGAPG